MAPRERATWLIAPPAEEISPELAKRWLVSDHPALADFARERDFAEYSIERTQDRAGAVIALQLLDWDVSRIIEACAHAIQTDRPVRVGHEGPALAFPPDLDRSVCDLRALLRLERQKAAQYARRPGRVPYAFRGVRRVLEDALRVWEAALARRAG